MCLCLCRFNSSFPGKYERVGATGLEKFQEALGVSLNPRKGVSAAVPTLDITLDKGVWTIQTSAPPHFVAFRLGKENEETTLDGRRVKVKVN